MTPSRAAVESTLHGAIPAVPTPFRIDGSLDTERIEPLVREFADTGVHGVSVTGSQGECAALTEAEHELIIRTAAAALPANVPLYAGTGATTTSAAIRLTRSAADAGASVAMVLTPYFISPDDTELVDHFTAVADASMIPVLLYNNPARTGVNVSPEVFRQCLAHERIVGIKDSSGDMGQVVAYLQHARQYGGAVFCGRDTLIVDFMLHGGAGAISPAAAVFPQLVSAIIGATDRGDWTSALRTARLLEPLRSAWRLGTFPVVIKEAMALVGRSVGPARAPVRPLTDAARAELTDVIRSIEAAHGESCDAA